MKETFREQDAFVMKTTFILIVAGDNLPAGLVVAFTLTTARKFPVCQFIT